MGFLRFRSRVSIHGSVGWVNSIEASGSKSCSCLRNSASLIRGVLQNGCRAGQRQYGSCSSAALPPTDLGKLRTVRSRRTSLFFQTGQPSSSRTISCEAVGASQPRTTLFQFRSQRDDRLGSRAENLTSSNLVGITSDSRHRLWSRGLLSRARFRHFGIIRGGRLERGRIGNVGTVLTPHSVGWQLPVSSQA